MSVHPNSLKNLDKGRGLKWSAARRERARFKDHVSPEKRRQISSAGARARAAKFMADKERGILRAHGPKGLALYREGRRDGANRTDMRWREWYEKEFGVRIVRIRRRA